MSKICPETNEKVTYLECQQCDTKTCKEDIPYCDSEHCAFNPGGICRLKAVYGFEPHLTDDGCEDYMEENEKTRAVYDALRGGKI